MLVPRTNFTNRMAIFCILVSHCYKTLHLCVCVCVCVCMCVCVEGGGGEGGERGKIVRNGKLWVVFFCKS